MSLTALLIDDEREARARLKRLLTPHRALIDVIGEATDGVTAVESIQTLRPELIFLDIQMPGCDGFGVLDSIPRSEWPLTVFVTAYDEFAIRAFEVHAVDYLLKPVSAERLATCLDRITRFGVAAQSVAVDRARREARPLERVIGRTGSRTVLVHVPDVIVFESEDKLVFARTAHGRVLLNVTMKELEERLKPEIFCRVHKQAIVQLRHARELQTLAGGHYTLILADGSRVEIGRKYAAEFRARFG